MSDKDTKCPNCNFGDNEIYKLANKFKIGVMWYQYAETFDLTKNIALPYDFFKKVYGQPILQMQGQDYLEIERQVYEEYGRTIGLYNLGAIQKIPRK